MTLSISAVERDTGLSKDTLRMWERRYGFPIPDRDVNGERVYPLQQVEKLQLIKRLMDRGHRPGKIIGRGIDDLAALDRNLRSDSAPADDVRAMIDLVRTHQLPELRRQLFQLLMRDGLKDFVLETVSALNDAVGRAWMCGDMAVFEEHLYTELVQTVLRNAIAAMPQQARRPRMLLTTFPNESHGIGLLMVEALLTLEGVTCIPLGVETPLPQIARAAQAHDADVVALSFSTNFNEKHASAGLRDLRSLLDGDIEIWAGGRGLARARKGIDGVRIVVDLTAMEDVVARWRKHNTTL